MNKTAVSLLTLFLAAPAVAEPVYIDDPAACGLVMGGEDGVLDYAGQGGLVLWNAGYSSLEYFCSFQPAINFVWDGHQVTDHMGRCELPGPQYFPKVFTVVLDSEQPGIVAIWDGGPEPVQFHYCGG
jgi:hypothetical protein